MTRRTSRRGGFTLLELVIATAMTAMLALTLYSTMVTAFRAKRSIANQTAAVSGAGIVLDLLERDLQSIQPAGRTLSGPFIGYAMGTSGAEADSLSFHALGRDDAGPAAGTRRRGDDADASALDGFRRIELRLRSDVGSTPALVRTVTRNLLATVQEPGQEEVLARNVRAFAVRYYDGTGWREEWDSSMLSNALPLAVELIVTFDVPHATSPSKPYTVSRIVPIATGQAPATTTGGTP
jgi:prepilin-type N-terminal cleavage/methylation domain-containing protein